MGGEGKEGGAEKERRPWGFFPNERCIKTKKFSNARKMKWIVVEAKKKRASGRIGGSRLESVGGLGKKWLHGGDGGNAKK